MTNPYGLNSNLICLSGSISLRKIFLSVSQRVSIYFNHCHSFKPTTMKFLRQHSFRICGLYDISLVLNQTVSPLLHFLFATGLFSTEHHNQPLILPTLLFAGKISDIPNTCWIKITLLRARAAHPLPAFYSRLHFLFPLWHPLYSRHCWLLKASHTALHLFTPPPPLHAPSN